MDKVVIYPNETGGLVFVYACDCGLTVEEIARKDVPSGKPYLIVDRSDFPEDTQYMDAWTADFTTPDGIGIGHDAWFAEQAAKEQ